MEILPALRVQVELNDVVLESSIVATPNPGYLPFIYTSTSLDRAPTTLSDLATKFAKLKEKMKKLD